jgi:hypothetical protein
MDCGRHEERLEPHLRLRVAPLRLRCRTTDRLRDAPFSGRCRFGSSSPFRAFARNVRFSNRPFEVERFRDDPPPQFRCRSRAHASLRNRRQGPSIMGFEDEVEQSMPRPLPLRNGRSKRTCELTSSIVPRGTSFHRLVETRVSFPLWILVRSSSRRCGASAITGGTCKPTSHRYRGYTQTSYPLPTTAKRQVAAFPDCSALPHCPRWHPSSLVQCGIEILLHQRK